VSRANIGVSEADLSASFPNFLETLSNLLLRVS